MLKNILSNVAKRQTVRSLTPAVHAELFRRQENLKKGQKQKEAIWDSAKEYGIYYAYPSLAAYYGTIAPFFSLIILFLLIFGEGILHFILGMSVYESGLWHAVNEVKAMLEAGKWYHWLGIVIFILFMGSLLFVAPILSKYIKNTVTIFSNKCVYVRRYLRKEKIVTYEELATSIKRRKICIKNGRYVIPCKGRDVSVSGIGGQFPKELFQLLETRCGIELPNDADNDRAGGTGVGWACGRLGSGILLGFGLIVSVIIFLFEGVFTWERAIFDLMVNPLLWVAVGLVALGLLMNLFTLPFVTRYYHKYHKTVRVSWMPILIDILILALAIGSYLYMRQLI